MEVTLQFLNKHHACSNGIAKFQEILGMSCLPRNNRFHAYRLITR